MKHIIIISSIFLLIGLSCQPKLDKQLEVIASSDQQWTGIAVSEDERIFVNFPKWSDEVPISVAELIDGQIIAYPNASWNNRSEAESFTAVQSVFIDDKNRLWILDTKNPQFQGVLEGGPVLYQFDLKENKKEKVYRFPKNTYRKHSYFNDVRINTEQNIAYISDSGDGALIVLNLNTGVARRVLDHHPSTESETDHLICDGIRWENSVHSDGIALSPDKQYVYYVALTGHSLYRIETKSLNNASLTNEQLAEKVEMFQKIPATDGMMFDKKGQLWLGGLEDNSINLLKPDKRVEKQIMDEQIRWADSFAIDAKGQVYFTSSQIHLPEDLRKSYQIFRLQNH